MPRSLFQDLTVSGRRRSGAGLRALPVSLTVHALAATLVAFAAARPAASELEEERDPGVLIYGPSPEPAKLRQVQPRASARPKNAPRHGDAGPAMPVPTAEPDGVRQTADPDAEPPPTCLANCGDGSGDPGAADGDDASDSGGVPGGDGDGIGPLEVGGDVRPPTKVTDALPVYPELARRIRVQGEVVIDCVIDETGRVAEARVVRGHSLLDAAALAAVRQWAYRPTRLNGRPIAVLMRVTVRFSLKP